jgi:DNA-directed RNA polymerase subunit D
MKVTIQEMTQRKARLFIEDSAPYFVNSLRRVLVSELPRLAINNVVLYDNNSGLFDEIVSHRIGLLPVPTEPDTFVFRKDCTCEDQGCPNCTVRFTLSKEGPVTVYAEDLQSEDAKFAIPEPKAPIVTLLKGQRLILEAEATLGVGREHARWQAVHGAGYSYMVTLKGGAKTEETVKAVAKGCPIDGSKVNRKYEITDAQGHVTLCDACLEGVQKAGVPVKYDDSKFVFTFETDGSLTAAQALAKASEILAGRVAEFEEHLAKLKAVKAPA